MKVSFSFTGEIGGFQTGGAAPVCCRQRAVHCPVSFFRPAAGKTGFRLWGWSLFLLLVSAVCILPDPAAAQEKKEVDPAFSGLAARLVKDGFDRERVERLYASDRIFFEPEGVSLFFAHSESSLDYDQFLSDSSMKKAALYMDEYKDVLEKAEKQYGVDKTIITAILLVETRLGEYLGKRMVLNTLSTMAALTDNSLKEKLWDSIADSKRLERKTFDSKVVDKSGWAYEELKALLQYTRREGLDPLEITGSYAGAMGISQFMPTNALILAEDGNKDGAVNLFDHTDAICSVANYLRHFGWEPSISRQQAHKILYKYNNSNYYVDTLLKISDQLKG